MLSRCFSCWKSCNGCAQAAINVSSVPGQQFLDRVQLARKSRNGGSANRRNARSNLPDEWQKKSLSRTERLSGSSAWPCRESLRYSRQSGPPSFPVSWVNDPSYRAEDGLSRKHPVQHVFHLSLESNRVVLWILDSLPYRGKDSTQ